jgi:hypothetical protein
MLRTFTASRLAAIAGLAFVLAGCAPAAPALTPTVSPVPATPTPQVWDLVIMSDSTLIGVGRRYAAFIQEDLGVQVELHDLWRGDLSAAALLDNLRNDEKWRSAAAGAEVIVYFGNPIGTATGDWHCVSRPYAVTDCSPETFTAYQAALEAVAEEILGLRAGAPTLLRATDFYVPVLSLWREAGVAADCTGCIETMNAAVHAAAAAHGVPVAHVYDAFNGPNHDQDARDLGYIGADGVHTSDLGKDVIAGLLRDLGYAPVGGRQ